MFFWTSICVRNIENTCPIHLPLATYHNIHCTRILEMACGNLAHPQWCMCKLRTALLTYNGLQLCAQCHIVLATIFIDRTRLIFMCCVALQLWIVEVMR